MVKQSLRVLDFWLVLPALWLAWLVLSTWWGRMDYPFDLEWMEGGMLVHAWRIHHGLPVYTDPDPNWIPFIYPPGYAWVVAMLGHVFGLSATVARAVSGASSLAAALALVFAGWRHGRTLTGGVLAACLFLACYVNTGAFYDLIRPDGLAIGLTAWALVLGLERDRRWVVVAGLLLAAGFTVKHNVALFGVPMALGIWADQGWRRGALFGLASAGPALVFVGVMEWTTDGLFLMWLLDVAGAHPMVLGRFVPGTFIEMGNHMGVLLPGLSLAFLVATGVWMPERRHRQVMLGAAGLGAVAGLWLGLNAVEVTWQIFGHELAIPRLKSIFEMGEMFGYLAVGSAVGATLVGLGVGLKERVLSGRWVYGTGVAAVALLLAALMRAHHGGFVNVYIPLYWVMCLTAAVAVGRLRMWRPSVWMHVVVLLPLLGQLGMKQDFDPERYLPTEADVRTGQRFVDALAECPEPVLAPINPYLAVLAGHEPRWHMMALWDIQHPTGPFANSVASIGQAVRDQRWSCVVMPVGRPMGHGFSAHYEQKHRLRISPNPLGRPGPGTFMPRTGWRSRPESLWVPMALE